MANVLERVMVVTAHPDDPEFGAGGTMAKLVKEGREVTYVIVTNGNKGSADRAITPERVARIREDEQRSAAQALGVERVEFLGYEDGEVEDTRQLRLDIARQIRRWRPDLIITQNPARTYGNFHAWHRDHRITGGVVLDCVYPLACDHLSFPERLQECDPHASRSTANDPHAQTMPPAECRGGSAPSSASALCSWPQATLEAPPRRGERASRDGELNFPAK